MFDRRKHLGFGSLWEFRVAPEIGGDFMDVGKIRQGLDRLVENHQMDKVEAYLTGFYNQAVEEKNISIQFTLLNDFIGFYKTETRYEKIVDCGNKAAELALELGLENSEDYVNTLMNMANAYREAGDFDNSMECYNKVLNIFEHNSAEDIRYADLYNNVSYLYQNDEQYDMAVECLSEAIRIVESYNNRSLKLAGMSLHLGDILIKNSQPDEALSSLIKSKVLFEINGSFGEEYTDCVATLGELYFTTGQYEKAAEYYERALKDIKNQNGVNDDYRFLESALKKTYSRMGIEYETDSTDADEEVQEQMEEITEYSLKDISWEYYNTYIKPMISGKFGQYEDSIAVGVAGAGAEIFSIDEKLSASECAPIRICMWMKKNIYEEIGEQLNEAYNSLPHMFKGYKVDNTADSEFGCGAMNMGVFFKEVLGVTSVPLTDNEWKYIDQWRLEQVTNGFIIKDTQGTFTKIREMLKAYYPDKIWLRKITNALAGCSKSGQHDYAEMMAKGDFVSAKIALSRYLDHIIELAYLLDRTYCPQDMKMHAGIRYSKALPELYSMIKTLVNYPEQREAWKEYEYNGAPNPYDNVSMMIESIGSMVSDKLIDMGLSDVDSPRLRTQADYIKDNSEYILSNIEYIKQKM